MKKVSTFEWLEIRQLKNIGHALLDEYIALDTYRGVDAERVHAYQKLAKKLGKDEMYAHFHNMTTKREVLEANAKLRKMIRMRKSKLKHIGIREYAPNLMSIQKGEQETA